MGFYHKKYPNIIKCYQRSSYVMKCHQDFLNIFYDIWWSQNDDFWWHLACRFSWFLMTSFGTCCKCETCEIKCHEVWVPKITKNVSKNMVTFSDISWLIMTLLNQLTEGGKTPVLYLLCRWPGATFCNRGWGGDGPSSPPGRFAYEP